MVIIIMIAAFDVHYLENGSASAAAVLFSDYTDPEPLASFTHILKSTAEYVPGEFYKRELPCILSLLKKITETPDEIIIDGYVMLKDKPGLGQHLFEHLDGKIPVIGVAKSRFAGGNAIEVCRGSSNKPLFITSAGLDPYKVSDKIKAMHGIHRIPAMLKHVDLLARENAKYSF
jgi:deoxyribonuclease V